MIQVSDLWPLIVSVLVVKLCHWIYQWGNPKVNGKLPPGSMGFPLIGETIEFMKPHDALQFSTFLTKRMNRYGPIFRTSVFGAKVIISTDSELNMEIAKASSVNGVPESVSRVFGKNNMFTQGKETHKHARNIASKLLGSQSLKLRMIQDMDLLAHNHMEVAATNGGFDVKETASKIIVKSFARKVMGDMDPETAKELEICWTSFPNGWFKLAYSIPGTELYRTLKAGKNMLALMKKIIIKKKALGEELGEFVDIIYREMEREGETVNVDNVVQYIYTLFIITHEITPSIIAAAVKLISDNPNVMQELQREHEAVAKSKTSKEAGITWEDYQSMTFTQMVINESLRIISTFPSILRVATEDLEVRGYTIPKGWTFMGYPLMHLSQETYDDPLSFNPWRWKGKDLNATVSKNFMPFGAGRRLCIGADFVKMQMAIFIHNLSRYRWSMDSDTTMFRRYILLFPNASNVHITGRYGE